MNLKKSRARGKGRFTVFLVIQKYREYVEYSKYGNPPFSP
jgi:hypothetical protein